MYVLYNNSYSNFQYSKEALSALNIKDEEDLARTDERVIKLFLAKGTEWISGRHSDINICEIPEDATDWWIDEFDGWEEVWCVRNGKRAFPYEVDIKELKKEMGL